MSNPFFAVLKWLSFAPWFTISFCSLYWVMFESVDILNFIPQLLYLGGLSLPFDIGIGIMRCKGKTKRVVSLVVLAIFFIPMLFCSSSDVTRDFALEYIGSYYGSTQQYGKQFHIVKKLSSKGHAKSQAILGWLYYIGRGTAQDTNKALQWLQMSFDNGYMFSAAMIHEIEMKIGTKQAEELGESYLQAAADAGDPKVMFLYGVYLLQRSNSEQDAIRAFQYIKGASDKSLVKAKQYLMCMYKNGVGVAPDVEKARAIYSELAADGLTDDIFEKSCAEN